MSIKCKITKEEFVMNYIEQSGFRLDELSRLDFHVVRCNCDYSNCDGWQIHHGKMLKQWRERGVSYYGDDSKESFPIAEMEFKTNGG